MDDQTSENLKDLLGAAEALRDSMISSVRSDGGSVWKYSGYKIFMRKYNQLAKAVAKVVPVDAIVDIYDLDRVLSGGDTIAFQQKEYFDSVFTDLLILTSFLESKVGVKTDRIQSLKDFFQANLRRALFTKPEREVDVQNAIEQLLIGRGMVKGVDYDRETGRVKVSIKEVIPDFLLPKLGMAIEAKLSKNKTKSKVIVDEINADIRSYGKEYAAILFIVYDLGSIRDEVEFKRDLEIEDSVSVIIVKH
ncbi:MAG: hypothetical protein WAM60_22435 [Candidatus Promineifilaceae bacterium]